MNWDRFLVESWAVFTTRSRQDGWRFVKIFAAVLGVGLVLQAAALIVIYRLDPGYPGLPEWVFILMSILTAAVTMILSRYWPRKKPGGR